MIIIVITILIICCEEENKDAQNQTEKLDYEINNITNVKLIELSKKHSNIDRCLFYYNEHNTYLINSEWDIYIFDLETHTLKNKVGNINVIDKHKLTDENERVSSFVYFDKHSLVEIKTLNPDTGKVNTYLFDSDKNRRISFDFIRNKISDDVHLELVGCFNNGEKALLLGYKDEETYSNLYLADINKRTFETLLDGSTILSFSLTDDRNSLVFFGNNEQRLPVELYDFTIRGNFFMYSREDNPAWLYILDLNKSTFHKVPNSTSYFYGSIYKDNLRVEDSYGEFINVDPDNGEILSDINNAVYKIMDYYKERYPTREAERYTLIKKTEPASSKKTLIYIDKQTTESIALLSIDKAHIQNITALNNEYAVFSVTQKDKIVGVYLIHL